MDWYASGIENTFSYVLVDPFNLETETGMLDGVTSGTITESYRGDYRAGAALTVDSEDRVPLDRLVRIYHTARLGGEAVSECLGTFFVESAPCDASRGRYVTKLSLQSCLYRLGTDIRQNDRYTAKGASIADYYRSIVAGSGGTAEIETDVNTAATFGDVHVWEAGKSCLSECNDLANALGGMLGVTDRGAVTIRRYVNPKARPDTFNVPGGSASVVKSGLSIAMPEIINRVAAYARKTDGDVERLFSQNLNAEPAHRFSFERIGRRATRSLSVSYDSGMTDAQIQAKVDSEASQALNEALSKGDTYGVDMLYAPIRCGEVGFVQYGDGSTRIGVHGLVAERKITLDKAMGMQLTIEEVA